jgi:hypothetical protein
MGDFMGVQIINPLSVRSCLVVFMSMEKWSIISLLVLCYIKLDLHLNLNYRYKIKHLGKDIWR